MSTLLGLIGYPLGHSFSREYHNRRIEKEGLDAVYENYELSDISLLTDLVHTHPTLVGLNVTIPYKEVVVPYLSEIDESAQRIGAVNVIKIEREGNEVRMVGYNSDYMGFRNSITPLLQPHHTHALVLGSGGASKAVKVALQDIGLTVQVVSRHPQKDEIDYASLTSDIMSSHQVIVNTTPLGMYPNEESCADIPYELLTSQHLCYDVVYNPLTTLFMKKAAEQGATVSNGLKMLYGQADASWEIWNIR